MDMWTVFGIIVVLSICEPCFRKKFRTFKLKNRLRWGVFCGVFMAALFYGVGYLVAALQTSIWLKTAVHIVFFGGAMNILVVYANGGRMPVRLSGPILKKGEAAAILFLTYSNHEEIKQKLLNDECFAQSFVEKISDPHCPLYDDEEHSLLHTETRLKFLADNIPISLPLIRGVNSLGDVVMYVGIVFAVGCLIVKLFF